MKQVFNIGGRITVIDVPAPAGGDNEVTVQNMFSVISSGTETASLGQGRKGKGILDIISRVKNDPELVKKVWEDIDGLGYVYIWQCLLSF